MLTEYTTYEDVRAALGVSEEEIDDATLGLDLFLTLLEEDLLAVNSAVPTTWAALPSDPDTDSADEKRFRRLVKLYSTFSVANQILNNIELVGFLKVADGRASTERTPKSFENTGVNVAAMQVRTRNLLLAALSVLVPSIPVPVPFVVTYATLVSGASDPVTNT